MSNHKSTESALKNLEVQVGQLAKQIADKSSNSFVTNTEQNPKEECKIVMTRSKRFVEVEDEDNVVAWSRYHCCLVLPSPSRVIITAFPRLFHRVWESLTTIFKPEALRVV